VQPTKIVLRADAALYWHDPGDVRTYDLGTDRKSANWLCLLALDKTEQKSRPHNRAFPGQEVAQISVLFRDVYAEPKDVLFGFMPKVRLRTCRRTGSNNLNFTSAVEEISIPAIGFREANSREARVVGCLLGHLRSARMLHWIIQLLLRTEASRVPWRSIRSKSPSVACSIDRDHTR
jgi:hypothetical protein